MRFSLRDGTISCLLTALFFFCVNAHEANAKRIALVIGISDYTSSPRLANPRRDASAMAQALRASGFDVVQSFDGNLVELLKTLESFYELMDGAEAAIFFFAGHGLQFDGINYLIPRDAQLRSPTRLKQETISLQDIISSMETRAQMTLVFLDACRDNPLADELQRSVQGVGRSAAIPRGLAPMKIRNPDTLLVFAAAPGRTALDGVDANSPFTTALLKNMVMPGIEIELMLKRVTRDVVQSTKGQQVPERLSRLTSEFVFNAERPTSSSEPMNRPSPVNLCASNNPPLSCLWKGK